MPKVQIVTDSTSDIDPAVADQLGITVIPLNVRFGDKEFRDRLDLSPDDFYRMLRESGEFPLTSQPPSGIFGRTYAQLCAHGDSVVSIHLSARLSGTFNAALAGRDLVHVRCPIEIVDSQTTSLGLGLIVLAAAKAAAAGATQREVIALIDRLIPNVHVLFFVDRLEYLVKGGRIGRAQGLVGSLLNIRPLLKLEDGEVELVEKVRTRSKAIDRLVEFVELFPEVDQMAIMYTTASADLEGFTRRLEYICPRDRTVVAQAGPVIGTHAGPGSLGVFVLQGSAHGG